MEEKQIYKQKRAKIELMAMRDKRKSRQERQDQSLLNRMERTRTKKRK